MARLILKIFIGIILIALNICKQYINECVLPRYSTIGRLCYGYMNTEEIVLKNYDKDKTEYKNKPEKLSHVELHHSGSKNAAQQKELKFNP